MSIRMLTVINIVFFKADMSYRRRLFDFII